MERLRFDFRGTGSEYFRIWIVNLLLTLLTLGIYSAWAKVRRLRYLYGSTFVADSAFEYHGQPVQILKGRAIAVAAIALYWVLVSVWAPGALLSLPLIAFGLPWIVLRSRLFQMHVSSWRNLRFQFRGNYRGALVAYSGWALLAAMSAYLMTPWWIHRRVQFTLGNMSFGAEPLIFDKRAAPFVRVYYRAALLGCVPTFGLLMGLSFGITHSLWLAPFIAALVLAWLAIVAFYQASIANICFDGLRLGPNVIRCNLRTSQLTWIYASNMLGLLFTLGLFHPWAKMRRLKYQFACMSVETSGELAHFIAASSQPISATAEELGDLIDVDFGL